jgi:hypothetical protein
VEGRFLRLPRRKRIHRVGKPQGLLRLAGEGRAGAEAAGRGEAEGPEGLEDPGK